METIINVTLPIFAIMALGYGCGRWKVLDVAAADGLNKFVYLIALPVAMFTFSARAPIGEILNWGFIFSLLLGMAATIAIAVLGALFIFRCDATRASFHGFLSIFANHGYMGIPVFLAAFGPEGALPPIVSSLAAGIPAMVVIMVVLELLRAGASGKLADGLTRMFVRNPLFIATMLGIAFSVFQIPVHRSAANLMDMLSVTAGPTALFALGLSLVGHPILGNIYETIWASVLKLVVQPLFTYILATEVFHLSPFWAASVVILSAMPVGSTAYLIGQQYGVAERVSSATVAVSTAGSVVTLTALMIFYGVS